ncbi:energy-coupling factor ABC transporter substrate-binding protein [Actinomadura alba]|uniref:Cobalt transport protein CbiN n=1 Tax=Actinomadura alba TaxID=406431 RepID=A0ABR7LSJ8_9ACTN|nr:energy-coupling factor ABC transporter substrate-binding protein [Actinomadura alba]MBC6467812.1 energy-coupling factor ABC transporter substrate-binding protein [Actinomadura alba]
MKRSTTVNLMLLLAVAALAVAPLVLGSGDGKEEPFTGSDGQAETAITENAPHYEPWFSSLYEPPSGEIESALFALQAAVGAGVLGYYFGVVRTRRRLAPAAVSAERPGSGPSVQPGPSAPTSTATPSRTPPMRPPTEPPAAGD